MARKYDHYSVSLSRDLQKRIKKLFDDFPDVQNEYKKGENPGYVKFIEEAIRIHIKNKEQFEIEKIRYTGKDKIEKELEKAYKDR